MAPRRRARARRRARTLARSRRIATISWRARVAARSSGAAGRLMTPSPSERIFFWAFAGGVPRPAAAVGCDARDSMRATDARITRMSALKRSSVRTIA